MGKTLLDEQAEVGALGFDLAFERLANANSSVFVSDVSCSLSPSSLLLKSVTNLFNCLQIQLLISTPYLPCSQQIVTSNTDPILVFPRIQPFGSIDVSSRGKMYSRHVTRSVNCKNSSMCFVMKYCPTSTVFKNPASKQFFINRSC